MNISKFAFILIAFFLFFGHESVSPKIQSIMIPYGESFELSATSLLNSGTACTQNNCIDSKSDCANSRVTSCADVATSAQCASCMSGLLIFNQSPTALKHSGSIPLNYNVPIYHDIYPGITPRPPKTAA